VIASDSNFGEHTRCGVSAESPRYAGISMSTRLTIIVLVLLSFAAVIGSQRLLRSDSAPQWLPRPDYRPDSRLYPLDRLGERLDILLASAGDERLELALVFAEEKFFEAMDMVRMREAGHAWIAVGLHKDYLQTGARQLDVEPVADSHARRMRYLNTLVRQLQTLAASYEQLPTQIRAFSLIPLISTTLIHFDQEIAQLPADDKSAMLITRSALEEMVKTMRAQDGGKRPPLGTQLQIAPER